MSIVWAYLQFRVLVWLLRMTGRLLLFAAVAALLVAAAPVTLVAAVGAGRGVAARLATGPAAPGRYLGAADDGGIPGRAGGAGPHLAGACPGPGA